MLAFVMNSPDTIQSPTDTGTLSSRRFASFGGVEILEGLGYPAYTDLPQGLEYKAVDILRKARRILDKWEDERGKDGLSPNANGSLTATPGGNGVRRFAVAGVEHGGSVLTSLGFSSTAGWLFEGQSTLRYGIYGLVVETCVLMPVTDETTPFWSNFRAPRRRKAGISPKEYLVRSGALKSARFIWKWRRRIRI